MINFHKKVLQE